MEPITELEIIDSYYHDKLNYHEISEKFGFPGNIVFNIIRKSGLQLREDIIITRLAKRIRYDFSYRKWVREVLSRGKRTCRKCKSKKDIQVHHIMFLNDIIVKYKLKNMKEAYRCKLLWNPNNGECLCANCHRDIHQAHVLNHWLSKVL